METIKCGNLAVVCLAALAIACGCRTVPVTGRRQFIAVTAGYENNLGASNYSEFKSKYKPVDDERQQAVLRRVGKALAAASGQTGFAWEFNVLDSRIENAFCLPGGKVAVFTGLMKRFANEAEMASVVAHEVGHAIARHGGERMSWGYLQTLGSLGLSKVAGADLQQIYGIGTEYGVMLPFSRSHETEADLIGLQLMAKAGYDPQAAVDFWRRFGTGSSDIITAITSTHPCDGDRIANLSAHLDEARELYGQSAEKRGFGVRFENGVPEADAGRESPAQPAGETEDTIDIAI